MALALASLAAAASGAYAAGGPNWQTPADTGTTPMPEPVVRVSDGCSFSCALGKLAAAGRGGGTVFVPRGVWLSPPVNLTSHLTVYLAAGAVIKADTKVFADGKWPLIAPLPNYGRGHPDYNSSVNAPYWGARWAPFIDGHNLTNVTIGGENGTIDGSGLYWWARHIAGVEEYTRPPLFSCLRCNDVLLEDTTFLNSGFWTIHPVLGRRLTARRLHLLSPNDAPNTDGFDPDSIQVSYKALRHCLPSCFH
jgi:polygalacturonase